MVPAFELNSLSAVSPCCPVETLHLCSTVTTSVLTLPLPVVCACSLVPVWCVSAFDIVSTPLWFPAGAATLGGFVRPGHLPPLLLHLLQVCSPPFLVAMLPQCVRRRWQRAHCACRVCRGLCELLMDLRLLPSSWPPAPPTSYASTICPATV